MLTLQLFTSNNMSVLFPASNVSLFDGIVTNLEEGDIIFAVYETGRVRKRVS